MAHEVGDGRNRCGEKLLGVEVIGHGIKLDGLAQVEPLRVESGDDGGNVFIHFMGPPWSLGAG